MSDNEEREDQDAPLFEVHEVGPVKFYEAAKGVDWLSQFPDDPQGGPNPETKLIDLPLAVEPSAPPASAAAPEPTLPPLASIPPRSVEVLYPPGPKRVPRLTIALSIAAVVASAAFLYWLVAPPRDLPPSTGTNAVARAPESEPDRLTMDALKPKAEAPVSTPSPTPRPEPRSTTPPPALRTTSTPVPRVTPTFSPRVTPTIPSAVVSAPSRVSSPMPTTVARPSVPAPPALTNAAASSVTPSPSPSPSPLSSVVPTPASPTPTPRPINSPAATPSPTSSVAPATPPVNTSAAETAAVRGVLDAYRAAYESLSSESVRSIWPGANAPALSRAFKQMESQSMDFYSCGIELGNGNAEATCTGAVTFVPKVGGKTPRVEQHRWTFFLVRRNDRWLIDRVVAR